MKIAAEIGVGQVGADMISLDTANTTDDEEFGGIIEIIKCQL
ncbi:MAG: hypothetical protein WCC63_05415 [Candidatus Bathyarchaeia archaeon]